MKANELRERYIRFFTERGHRQIPSAPLLPENDPSVLFTTAGMHPLVPFLLGEPHPLGRRLVNTHIQRDLAVSMAVMPREEALASGALAFFGEKYGEQVKVYTIGDFSKEVCGGPHVTHTGELGRFKITKQEPVGQGVRRIRAVLEERI